MTHPSPEHLIITGATVLPMGGAEPLSDAGVAIRGERIVAVGPTTDIVTEHPGARRVAADGGVLTPGFVNTHCHLGLSWSRGLAVGDRHPVYDVFWPMEGALTPDLVRDLAMVAAADSLLSGTTTVADHYFHADASVEATTTLGLRSAAGATVLTLEGPLLGDPVVAPAEAERFVDTWLGHRLVHPSVTPHAVDTVDSHSLRDLAALARDRGVALHLHLAQSEHEVARIAERNGCSPVAHADELGLLGGGPTLAAHCMRTDGTDLAILADRPHTTAVYCPTVHGLDGVTLRAGDLLDLGGRVSIGTDAPPNDRYSVLAEARTAVVAQGTLTARGDALGPATALELATTAGAAGLGLDAELGRLAPGLLADLVLFDPLTATMAPLDDPIASILMGADTRAVRQVWVGGIGVVDEGRLVFGDEHVIAERATTAAGRLRERAGLA